MTPAPEPLTPAEVQAILQPDPRTRAADLYVLRDALSRMADALERLSAAVQELDAQGKARPAGELERDPRHPGRAD